MKRQHMQRRKEQGSTTECRDELQCSNFLTMVIGAEQGSTTEYRGEFQCSMDLKSMSLRQQI